MKNFKHYIATALCFVGVVASAQDIIVKEGLYEVEGTETLTARQEIHIKPETWIRPGSNWHALINENSTGNDYQAPVFSSDHNYIFTRIYQQERQTLDALQSNADVIETITYFDGLGRPMQQIDIKASPENKDIVTHVDYDAFGRQDKQYLPFERTFGNLGSYQQVDIIEDINDYYLQKYPEDFTGIQKDAADFNAYSQSIFEPSPLNRVVKQGAPGKSWKADEDLTELTDHTIKMNWATNVDVEVPYFRVLFTDGDREFPTLLKDGYYDENDLMITIIKDENWQPGQTNENEHTIKEYTDKQGRMVLKRTYDSSSLVKGSPVSGEGAHDTYYVYDDYGNLTYVIPPKVTLDENTGVSEIDLSELCYQYKYDGRNRLIAKKIPGKGWEYVVYNNLDKPVLTQDTNLENSGFWLFTKYDAFGRIVYTGKSWANYGRDYTQQNIDMFITIHYEHKLDTPITIANTDIYYSNNAFFGGDIEEVHTINYYDDYTFDKAGLNLPQQTTFGDSIINYNNATATRYETKGLATGSKVKVLDTDDWITTLNGYDDKGRVIYVINKNEYLNSTDIIEIELDFAGKVLRTKTTHTKDNHNPIITLDSYTYDHMGRLLHQTQQINEGTTERIASNQYDELGQLESKKVGGIKESEGLQKVDFNYNVRGWLTTINEGLTEQGDLFGFKINYDRTEINEAIGLYNGNISETHWKTANDNIARNYRYEYDALNRITKAVDNSNNYRLGAVSYDKNGNITRLARKGHTNESATSFDYVDDLDYFYDAGNKLMKVTDYINKDYGFKDGLNTGDDYEYDLNGNMVVDRNKGIDSITYNHLNLPTEISFGLFEKINYVYDATGQKLEKKVTQGKSGIPDTFYAGNYIYKTSLDPSDGYDTVLEFFNHPEGYIEPENDGSFTFVYQYKDHLGNIRLSFKDVNDDGTITTDEIVEEKNYYPFGMTHKGYNTAVLSEHPYGYNGKEEQNELGLGWLDYGARNYDPSIGKWFNLDPQAERYDDQSGYTYGLNNPVYFIDPDGEKIDVTELAEEENKSKEQQERDKWLLLNLMVELSFISGQEITSETKDGKTFLKGSGGCGARCTEGNAYISHLLGDGGTIRVESTTSGSITYPHGEMELDAAQINGSQVGLRKQKLDPITYGVGMTFLHESLHTTFGASFFQSTMDENDKLGKRFIDPTIKTSKKPGDVVSRINRFRKELGLPTRERYFEENNEQFEPTLLFKKDGNEYRTESKNVKLKK